jgi:hypothetical protein
VGDDDDSLVPARVMEALEEIHHPLSDVVPHFVGPG